ncbi:MAG: IPT/TIG domain-containing protein [Candidatus Kapabacteria bacterium]|nr:IPT/TIG domain-containing protein [Candidatus Kapabacteria bacterium]
MNRLLNNKLVWILVCTLALVLPLMQARAQDGSVGFCFPIVTGFNGDVTSIVKQADGKIVVGGLFTRYNNVERSVLARFNSDGTLDSTKFVGISGVVYAVAIQTDGKILVGGDIVSNGGIDQKGVYRFNPDGTLDPSFSSGITLAAGPTPVQALAIQADGKILIGGGFQGYGGDNSRKFLVRVNSDGSLDNTFGNNYPSDDGFGNTLPNIHSIALQPDGKIIVGGSYKLYLATNPPPGGTSSHPGSITRLLSNGDIDPTFNGPLTSLGTSSIRVQPDGKILALRHSYLSAAFGFLAFQNADIIRLNSDGTNDGSFVPWTMSANGDRPSRTWMEVQSDGKILVSGRSGDNQGGIVARLNSNGNLDLTFNRVQSYGGYVGSFTTLSDGRIVVGGSFTSYDWYQQQRITCLNGTPAPSPTANYSGTMFSEAVANNGTITTTQTITLGGTAWASSIANGSTLTAGTHYTVTNVPAGLTMVLTKTSSTQVQISFTGAAAAHANANDVNNVQITFLNAAVQNGNVAVIGGLNGQNLSIDFANPAILPPTLTCTALTSTGGNVVVLNGTNFTGATSVRFGGVNASAFTVVSSTQISATVAFGSTSGTYTVTTPGGTASCPNFTYVPTPPIINSFTPAFGVSPQTVTIRGANFLGTTQVTFGGVPATIVSVSNSRIVVTLGVGTVSLTPVNVSVTKPDGTATVGGFVYSNVPPIPNVANFTPQCGTTGTVVTINGTGFSGASSVKFGGTPASFTIVNDSQILATVKAGATGAVTVTSLSGSHSLPGFTYLALPTITNFTPTNTAAGTLVTITGTNFTAGCGITTQGVWFGGVPATSFTVVSPTQIQATIGAGGTNGTVQIVRTDAAVARRTGLLFDAPTITGVSPAAGTTGTAVTITGTNFLKVYGTNGVQINGANAASYTVVSDTQIIARPAANAQPGLGNVVVRSGTQTATQVNAFTFTPPPTIQGFYASYGTTGATITIYGQYFTGAFQVKFGNMLGNIVSVGPNQVVATVGAGITVINSNAIITTPGGVGSRGTFRFATNATATAPTITTVAPQPVSRQDSTLTINGTNLSTTTGVLLNGVPLQIISAAPTQVQVRIPSASASGTLTLYAHGGTTTTPVTVHPLPTITSFSATSGGPGTMVTIIGSGFIGTKGPLGVVATGVRFGNTNAASYTVVNDNTIIATVGTGATGPIRVIAPGGTVFSSTNFTYIPPTPPPTITNISTDIGTTGTVVTITGTNFVSGSTNVSFGGVPASGVTFVSATQIRATVAAGNSGNIVVTTPNGSANTNAALGVNFTYLPHPLPVITSFNPTSRMEGQTVTIVGNYLAGTSVITIGGAAVTSFVVNGDGSITATVPSGAVTGKIKIFKNVTSPTNTLIAESTTDLTIIPLLAFLKEGSLTSGESHTAKAGEEITPSFNGAQVFPNPAQTSVTIQTALQTSGLVRLNLRNALGSVVWTSDVQSNGGAFEQHIHVGHLPPGYYTIELNDGVKRIVQRFVKQ